ncbi:MAG: penicillin-binding protein [Micavibrio aeruginosavorus]|uniref:Penicillin-binding protein 1A n=1 Tax=Micavibrio aeruginosavorus TaxID=349221 RepID=A0A2W5FLQ9_9BACT|nr:MAG: penicillin-binding protein [Micavibrio aeruginosavorus]
MKFIGRFLVFMMSLGFLGAIAGVLIMMAVFYKYGQSLPDFSQLKDYKPPVVSRVHAGDGRFLAEFAEEKRIFLPIDEIPPLVKNAFISAEDQNFYQHKGVDLVAVARAVVTNFKNRSGGGRQVGASTITQQVVKNFLLTNERSYERKIREAILAYRIENAIPKDRILELYLNQIFLGYRSYGVAAAGIQYFNKSLDELTIAEAAFLAGLPKAPSDYHPVRNHEAALARRNWVIERMRIEGFITAAEAKTATETPLVTIPRNESDVVSAPYYAEEVRRELVAKFGLEGVKQGGLSVRTSVDPALQAAAEKSLRDGLMLYDRRHGWRGPLQRDQLSNTWTTTLTNTQSPAGMLENWRLAMVLSSKGGRVDIGLSDDTRGQLTTKDVEWVASKPLRAGDIIMVEPPVENRNEVNVDSGKYGLRQIPTVEGALVAIEPASGRVLAMQGGWKFAESSFNRATQAQRQPGSAFKPFIYLAALDKGFTPSSLIVDAPISFTDSAGNVWNPENYTGKTYGPTPLRVGVEKSRNLMTIRLAQDIGIKTVVEYAKNFGVNDNMKPHLANALGATETTLLKLTTGYAMIVNGGKKISPVFIDRVQDRYGDTVENADKRPCAGCGPLIRWEDQTTPDIPDTREQIGDPRTCYQMVSILEGVVQRGTGKALASLDIPLAGKTGTTNDSKDAWFIGFTPDLAIGVFVGFDEPKSLGEKETGGSAAVPIFKDFVETALKDVPPTPFRIPPGVRMVQVNATTGRPTSPADPNAIWEAYLAGTEPNNDLDYGPIKSSTASENLQVDEPLPASEMLEPNPDANPNAPTSIAPTGTGTGGIY